MDTSADHKNSSTDHKTADQKRSAANNDIRPAVSPKSLAEAALQNRAFVPDNDLYSNHYICCKNVFAMMMASPNTSRSQASGADDNKKGSNTANNKTARTQVLQQPNSRDRARFVMKRIIERMNPKPRDSEVLGAIMRLMKTPIPGTTSESVLLLGGIVEDGHLYLAKSVVQDLTEDIVRRAAIEAAQISHTPSRRFAFDISRNSSAPYIFNCIDVVGGRPPSDAKSSSSSSSSSSAVKSADERIPNASYLDRKQLAMTLDINCDLSGKRLMDSLGDAFDKAEHYTIDGPPEDLYWYQHLCSVYWTKADLVEWKLGSLEEMDQRALEIARQAKCGLRCYPEEVLIPRDSPEFAQAVEQEKARGDTAAFYSIAEQIKLWKKAAGFD